MKTTLIFIPPFSVYHSSALRVTLTLVAEGDLAARAVLAPFQRVREDVKASEAARAEPSLSASCCAAVLNTQPLLHFYIHSGASELLPCCFLVFFF